MIDRLFRTIAQAYNHSGKGEPLSLEDKKFASKVASFGKIAAVAIVILTLALAIFALTSGGFGGFLMSFVLGSLAIVGRDLWKICDNIHSVVNGNIGKISAGRFNDNERYEVAAQVTLDSWVIGPITLASIGR